MCLLLRSSWLTMTAAGRSRRQTAASPGRAAPVAEAVGVAAWCPDRRATFVQPWASANAGRDQQSGSASMVPVLVKNAMAC